jgi:hypothetical protein
VPRRALILFPDKAFLGGVRANPGVLPGRVGIAEGVTEILHPQLVHAHVGGQFDQFGAVRDVTPHGHEHKLDHWSRRARRDSFGDQCAEIGDAPVTSTCSSRGRSGTSEYSPDVVIPTAFPQGA